MTAISTAEPTRGRGRPRTGGGRDFLSVREAAEGQGVHPDTIRWHIRKGHIPHFKRGARVLIPRKAYEAQLQGAGAGADPWALTPPGPDLEAVVERAVERALRRVLGGLGDGAPAARGWAR